MADEADKTAEFAERETALATERAELDRRKVELDERDRLADEAAREARHQANVSFAEGMIAGGKLKPFGKDKLVGLLDTLDTAAVVSFGEAGDLAPIDVFKDMLTAADPFVSFGELAKDEGKEFATVSFAAPPGYTVEPASLELHGKALAYQASHEGVGYLDAVKAVS